MRICGLQFKWLLLLFVISGTINGLYLQGSLSDPDRFYLLDSAEYLHAADNLLAEGTLYSGPWKEPFKKHYYSRRPPGYPALIAMCRFVSKSIVVVTIVQIIMHFITFLCLIGSMKIMHVNEKFIAISASVFLCSPAQIIYNNMVMSEIFAQLCCTAAFYCYLRVVNDNRVQSMWLANFF